MQSNNTGIFGAKGASGIKSDIKINPQKIKNLLSILSAKNPNIGCIIEEQICEILIIIVAIAIEKPNFAAINGIIGLRKPLYTSATRCAKHNQIIAFVVVSVPLFINDIILQAIF